MPKLTDLCAHCDMPIGDTRVTLTHQSKDAHHETAFCSADCMVERLYEDGIKEKIRREVQKELNWLHKQICPSCIRRSR